MTVNELRTYLKDFPDEWEVSILIKNTSGEDINHMEDGAYPVISFNSIGTNSEYYLSGPKGYCIRGPQVFLEI